MGLGVRVRVRVRVGCSWPCPTRSAKKEMSVLRMPSSTGLRCVHTICPCGVRR